MADTIAAGSSPSAAQRDREELHAARFAMRLSLGIGVLMLLGKTTAYLMTGSAAILSDFAESVVHVIAVAFAAFSLRLSTKPAAPRFLYGYERIAFFSAGFEGAMIIVAAIWILVLPSKSGWPDSNWNISGQARCCCWPQAFSMPGSAGTCCGSASAATRSSSKPMANMCSPTRSPASE